MGMKGVSAAYHDLAPFQLQEHVTILGGRDYKAPLGRWRIPLVVAGFHMWTLLDVQLPTGATHVLRLENWGYDPIPNDRSACVVVYALHSAPRIPWKWGMRFDDERANGVDGTKYEGKEGELFRQWKVPPRCRLTDAVSLAPVLGLLKCYSKREYRIDTHSCQTLIQDIHRKVGRGDCVVVESGPQRTSKTPNWWFTQRVGGLAWRYADQKLA